MKRLTYGVVALALACALTGCGNSGGATSGNAEGAGDAQNQQTIAAGTPEEILKGMQADFNDTAQGLYDSQQTMFDKVGDTYEDYCKNEQLVQDWYALTLSETEELNARTLENSKAYFQSVIDMVDTEDADALDDAIDAYYDAIYDDAYGDYYDALYEDMYEDAYDQYYDGIIADEFDVADDYSSVYDVHSDAYSAWSDGSSDVYGAISDGRSDVYEVTSNAYGAKYDDDFTLDEIFRESVVNVKKDEDSKSKVSSTEGQQTEDKKVSQASDKKNEDASKVSGKSSSKSVSADFKATMDSYEEFFDKYVEFMEAYDADSSSTELLAQYADMMSQYAEMSEKLDEIDTDSLSTADYAYYTEVLARITSKLAEVGQ